MFGLRPGTEAIISDTSSILKTGRKLLESPRFCQRTALVSPHIVFVNRVTTIESTLITQTFNDALRSMVLFTRSGLVFSQPQIDLGRKRIKLGTRDRCRLPIPPSRA